MRHNERERQWKKIEWKLRVASICYFRFHVPAHDQSIDSLTSFTVNKTMMIAERKKRVRVYNFCGEKKLSGVCLCFFPFSFPYRTDVNWKMYVLYVCFNAIAVAYNFKSKKQKETEENTHKKSIVWIEVSVWKLQYGHTRAFGTHFIIFHFYHHQNRIKQPILIASQLRMSC